MKKNENIDSSDADLKNKLTIKQKSSRWFNEKFMPGMSKFASQTHLTAIRDAFGILTPIIIGGSISFLLGILIFGAGGNTQTSLLGLLAKASGGVNTIKNTETGAITWELLGAWSTISLIGEKIFQTVFDYSMGLFSLMIVVILGWIYAQKRGLKEPVFVAVLNMVCFLIFAVVWNGGTRFNYFFDSKGMLAAILITFMVVEIFRAISRNKKLLIKMPKQVPPMVATGFSLLLPVFLTLIIVSGINTAAWSVGYFSHWGDIKGSSGNVDLAAGTYGLVGLFFKVISAPFSAILSNGSVGLGVGISYQFLIGFFWFFGLNGSSVVNGAYYPFLLQMFMQNADAVSSMGYAQAVADGGMNVISIQFLENYSQTTGWGHTGALLLAIAIFGKVREHKEVAKLAAVPGIFCINEPVTFGLPLMLHPVLGVAAMFAMPITTFVAWLAVGPMGIVNYSYIMVPWTLPPGVGALLSTGIDWRAFVLAWVCLAVVFAWYIPFVLIANKYHFALNVQAYVSQGMDKKEAVELVKKDYADGVQESKEKKLAKKEHSKLVKQQNADDKQRILALPVEERNAEIHKIKMAKKEVKSLARMHDIQERLEEKVAAKKTIIDSVKVIADVVEYGGYKIRINGKTFATAMTDVKMNEMCIALAKSNKATYYTVVKNGQEIKKVDI